MPADRSTADLLRELVGKATEGKWFVTPSCHVHSSDDRETIVFEATGAPSNPTVQADARLIVALANVAPLIATVLGPDDLGGCRECGAPVVYLSKHLPHDADCSIGALDMALRKELER